MVRDIHRRPNNDLTKRRRHSHSSGYVAKTKSSSRESDRLFYGPGGPNSNVLKHQEYLKKQTAEIRAAVQAEEDTAHQLNSYYTDPSQKSVYLRRPGQRFTKKKPSPISKRKGRTGSPAFLNMIEEGDEPENIPSGSRGGKLKKHQTKRRSVSSKNRKTSRRK